MLIYLFLAVLGLPKKIFFFFNAYLLVFGCAGSGEGNGTPL